MAEAEVRRVSEAEDVCLIDYCAGRRRTAPVPYRDHCFPPLSVRCCSTAERKEAEAGPQARSSSSQAGCPLFFFFFFFGRLETCRRVRGCSVGSRYGGRNGRPD